MSEVTIRVEDVKLISGDKVVFRDFKTLESLGILNGIDLKDFEKNNSMSFEIDSISGGSFSVLDFSDSHWGFIEEQLYSVNGKIVEHYTITETDVGEVNSNKYKDFSESKDFNMKDSGERQSFDTGAVRDTSTGKPRPDLISPFFMERLGMWLGKGAEKYDPWNWAKGIDQARCFESLTRHIMSYQQGKTDEDHLAAMACNIMFLLHNEEVTKKGIKLHEGGVSGDSLVNMPIFSEED